MIVDGKGFFGRVVRETKYGFTNGRKAGIRGKLSDLVKTQSAVKKILVVLTGLGVMIGIFGDGVIKTIRGENNVVSGI